MPWCKGRTRLLNHFIDCHLVLIPFFTVSPVLLRNLPLLFRCVLTVIEPLQLGILINLHPEFNNDSTPVVKLLLELIHFIIGTLPVIFTAKAFQTLYHHASVPGPVKNRNMSVLGKPGPESPQIMSRLLMRLWAGNWTNLIASRIESFRDPLDVSALSCRIPAFIRNDNRYLFAVKTVVQIPELMLQLL